jgi:hypothetical protein
MLRSFFNIPSRGLYSKVPKSFYKIPYNKQHEQRDFVWVKQKNKIKKKNTVCVPSLKDLSSVKTIYINTDNIPDKLTINKNVSLELLNIVNNRIKVIKEENKHIENGRTSPW